MLATMVIAVAELNGVVWLPGIEDARSMHSFPIEANGWRAFLISVEQWPVFQEAFFL